MEDNIKKKTDQETVVEYTPEQLEEMKLASIKNYNDQTEILEAQLQYELKLTELQRTRTEKAKLLVEEVYHRMSFPPKSSENPVEEKKPEAELKPAAEGEQENKLAEETPSSTAENQEETTKTRTLAKKE